MIRLIKTITKNGETKQFPMLAGSQEQANELLKDPRFSLDKGADAKAKEPVTDKKPKEGADAKAKEPVTDKKPKEGADAKA